MIILLGVKLKRITHNEILRQIENATKPFFVVTVNPEILLHARKDPSYRQIINSADLRVVDGFGIVLLARLLYGLKLERFPGADLANEILKWAGKNNKRVFLLGGTKEANEEAIKGFRVQGLGFRDITGLGGDFNERESIEKIDRFNPDVLFVALGAPKQETFIHNLLQTTNYKLQTLMLGIGGTIDYWAYPYLRAPNILRRIGMEWLWRLILQPWRLARIFNAIILFPLACLWEKILLKWQNEKH